MGENVIYIKNNKYSVLYGEHAPSGILLLSIETDIAFFELQNKIHNIPRGIKSYTSFSFTSLVGSDKTETMLISLPPKLSIKNIKFDKQSESYGEHIIHYELEIYAPTFDTIFSAISHFFEYSTNDYANYDITRTKDFYTIHIHRHIQRSAKLEFCIVKLNEYKDAIRFSQSLDGLHSFCSLSILLTIPLPIIMAFLSILKIAEYSAFWCIMSFLHLLAFPSIWTIIKDKSGYLEKAFAYYYLQCFLHCIIITSFIIQIVFLIIGIINP